jgi:hypothetical protein
MSHYVQQASPRMHLQNSGQSMGIPTPTGEASVPLGPVPLFCINCGPVIIQIPNWLNMVAEGHLCHKIGTQGLDALAQDGTWAAWQSQT